MTRIRRFLAIVAMSAGMLALGTTAHAAVVIDFGTGLAGSGGTVTWYADGSLGGVGIPIGVMTVNIDGTETIYIVTGQADIDGGGIPDNAGSLDFATGGTAGTNSISISGCISALGLGDLACSTPFLLLSGTFSSATVGPTGLIVGTGPDTKNASLLRLLGIDPNLGFEFFGFSITTTNLTQGGASGTALSTDVRNTAVPEPASMLLLGGGLLGLATAARRRLARKS